MRSIVLSGISTLAGYGAAVAVNSLLDRSPAELEFDDPITPVKSLNTFVRWTLVCSVGVGVARFAASQIEAARREGEISDIPPLLRD